MSDHINPESVILVVIASPCFLLFPSTESPSATLVSQRASEGLRVDGENCWRRGSSDSFCSSSNHKHSNLVKCNEKEQEWNSKRSVHPNVHSSTIYNAKIWKQSKCPSTVEWIKIWYIEWMKICDNLEGWGRGGERWEGGLGRRGHRCTYGWFLLIYDRKPQNSVKQLSFN